MTTVARLQHKVALVTGGASGIGLAIVERFHAEGACVVIADISGEQTAVAARLGERALGVRADVSISADVQAMLKTASDHFGGLDILCNNAGIDGDLKSIADFDEHNYERVMAINLRSVFLGMKYGIPLLKQRGGGSIINTSSLASLIGKQGLGIYGASKAAINQLTRSAAVEYAADRIRVNAICPGGTETAIVAQLVRDHPEAVAASLALTPIGRFAQPAEIANVALFLASDESSYVTGVALPVDGGYSVL